MLYFVAIFLPPLAVVFCGFKPITLFLNIILTLLGWLPGILHALFVVSATKADARTKKITEALDRQTKELRK